MRHRGKTLQLTEEDIQQSWASWHDNEEVNKQQAQCLAANIDAKKAELIQHAVFYHLKHSTTRRKAQKYLHITQDHRDERIRWVFWRKQAIAVYTKPTSSIKDKRYYLTWFWKFLVEPIKVEGN